MKLPSGPSQFTHRTARSDQPRIYLMATGVSAQRGHLLFRNAGQ